MYFIVVPDQRKVRELEEEIELLMDYVHLDKTYFQRKYQLQLKRRQSAFNQMFWGSLLVIVLFGIILAIMIHTMGRLVLLHPVGVWIILAIVGLGFISVGAVIIAFVRKYDYSLISYSKRLNLELMKQYQQSQE